MAHWRQCHEADAARRVVVVDFVVVAEYLCLGAAFGRHAGNGCAAAAGSLEGRDELPQQAARMEPEEELWNEWEIQVLVLVSFSLQVFLLLLSGIRKRTTSNVLSIFIWLAYVSADSLAIFVLGHLALHINGRRHGLVLFWAPFMLLHLGGQETITAFSMEDNMLWKRHLLTLATQVGLAAYVVGKQWQGDKQLLAPMVLIFISGTIKYACRTSALMFTAEQTTPGSNLGMQAKGWSANWKHYSTNNWMMNEVHTYNELLWEANAGWTLYMAFLMDMTPLISRPETYSLKGLLSKEHRVYVSYKLAELQLSIVYDYFYTKLGVYFEPEERLNGRFAQLATLGSTFAALFLFARGNFSYDRADIVVSYILLSGAFILEILSVFIVVSSFWAYFMATVSDFLCTRCHDVIFSIVKLVHPESKPQWSQKLAQYNLIIGCIKQKRAAAGSCLLKCMKRVIGIQPSTMTHVDISHELKKLVLDKLLQVLISDSIQRAGFMSAVLAWHIATDISFFHEDELGCSSPSRGPSRELSKYVMYLSAKHGILSGNDGHMRLRNAQEFIVECLEDRQEALDQDAVVRSVAAKIDNLTEDFEHPRILTAVEPVLIQSGQLAKELLKMKEANDRWDIIMNVWMEMLCYMAFHCGPGFHIKQVSKGGEFISHACEGCDI
ncbi:hypothetical protein OsJ_25991 [Oryza sativa Japonica Group]|uniref:DUF4220 domain-containing protein n=2 Tax=Oryza sativa subsp. japonica TaxID=39947 RepID=B9FZ03_ORYSJ|nr:hypothetical protein OsJ_25991 [Oryza sativa Japonica Group]